MSQSTVLRHAISAGHVLDGHPLCGRRHGHDYEITVTIPGSPSVTAFGLTVDYLTIVKIRDVINELNRRDLTEMMPASIPSAAGMAAYLLARLSIFGVTKVEVHEQGTGVGGIAES